MKKLFVFCFFVFLIPAMGCVGSANIEHVLLANLSEVTSQTDEKALGAVVFALLEATTGAEIDTTVDETGKGTIRYGFAYEPDVLQQAVSELPPGFLDALNCSSATRLLLEGAPEGAVLTEEQRGAELWCLVQIPFENLLELDEYYRVILNPLAQTTGRIPETTRQAPLFSIRCLEFVDGTFYQDLVINQDAIKGEDTELLDVFGIDVQWRFSAAGEIRNHNGLGGNALSDNALNDNALGQNTSVQHSSSLSWNLLESPDRIAINMQPEDACPSSRVKLLLEFTNTETTLATLTIPISRRSDDYLQNEAVRQRLSQHGWITQIEGSANHLPRIIALQQFERDELALILSTIPGVEIPTDTVDAASPQPASDSSTVDGSNIETVSLFDLTLDLNSFSNTWALLMPTQAPTAFELVINSMQGVKIIDGEWNDPAHPILIWNGSVDDTDLNFEFALDDSDQTLLALTQSEDSVAEEAEASAETNDENGVEAESETEVSLENDGTDTELQVALLPTKAAGVLGPESPNRVADLPTSAPTSAPTSTSTSAPTSTSTPVAVATSTATPKPTFTSTSTPTTTSTSTPSPTSTPLATNTPTAEPTPTPEPAVEENASGSSSVATVGDIQESNESEADNRVALRPSVGAKAAAAATTGEAEDAQTIGDLIETAPSTSTDVLEEDNLESESSDNTNSLLDDGLDGQPIAITIDESTREENESALALKVADLLDENSDEEQSETTAQNTTEATTESADEASNESVDESTTSAADALEAAQTRATEASSLEPSLPTCQVVIDWLNLRPGPGLEYGEPVAALPQATELLVVGQGPYGTWIEVIATKTLGRGWVSLSPEFVICEADLSDVPKVDLSTFVPSDDSSLPDASVNSGASDTGRGALDVNALTPGQ